MIPSPEAILDSSRIRDHDLRVAVPEIRAHLRTRGEVEITRIACRRVLAVIALLDRAVGLQDLVGSISKRAVRDILHRGGQVVSGAAVRSHQEGRVILRISSLQAGARLYQGGIADAYIREEYLNFFHT